MTRQRCSFYGFPRHLASRFRVQTRTKRLQVKEAKEIIILIMGVVGSQWEQEYRCFLPFVVLQILHLINSTGKKFLKKQQ